MVTYCSVIREQPIPSILETTSIPIIKSQVLHREGDDVPMLALYQKVNRCTLHDSRFHLVSTFILKDFGFREFESKTYFRRKPTI